MSYLVTFTEEWEKLHFCAVTRFWIRLWIRYLTLPVVGHFFWIPNFLNKFFPIVVDINMNQRKITFSFSSKQKQLFADVLENMFLNLFENYTVKRLWQSLCFNKVASLRLATLLKRTPWHRYFPVNFRNFSEDLFL